MAPNSGKSAQGGTSVLEAPVSGAQAQQAKTPKTNQTQHTVAKYLSAVVAVLIGMIANLYASKPTIVWNYRKVFQKLNGLATFLKLGIADPREIAATLAQCAQSIRKAGKSFLAYGQTVDISSFKSHLARFGRNMAQFVTQLGKSLDLDASVVNRLETAAQNYTAVWNRGDVVSSAEIARAHNELAAALDDAQIAIGEQHPDCFSSSENQQDWALAFGIDASAEMTDEDSTVPPALRR